MPVARRARPGSAPRLPLDTFPAPLRTEAAAPTPPLHTSCWGGPVLRPKSPELPTPSPKCSVTALPAGAAKAAAGRRPAAAPAPPRGEGRPEHEVRAVASRQVTQRGRPARQPALQLSCAPGASCRPGAASRADSAAWSALEFDPRRPRRSPLTAARADDAVSLREAEPRTSRKEGEPGSGRGARSLRRAGRGPGKGGPPQPRLPAGVLGGRRDPGDPAPSLDCGGAAAARPGGEGAQAERAGSSVACGACSEGRAGAAGPEEGRLVAGTKARAAVQATGSPCRDGQR